MPPRVDRGDIVKISTVAGILLAVAFASTPVRAADDVPLARMATCQDSWLDWNKTAPAKNAAFAEHFRPLLSPHGNDPYFLPKAKITFAGLNVSQVYPESIGMALGFSVAVDAPFDKARAALEKIAGKKLGHCENSDGMHTCAVQIAEQRTITAMPSTARSRSRR